MLRPLEVNTLIGANEEIYNAEVAQKSNIRQKSVAGKLLTKEAKVQTLNPYELIPNLVLHNVESNTRNLVSDLVESVVKR